MHYRSSAAAVILAVAMAQPALAQQSSERDSTGTIIVTGQQETGQVAQSSNGGLLGNRSVFDTPFQVTGYTDQLITDQQARSLADVLDNNPAVRIEGSAFSDAESQLIRGFDAGAQSQYLNGLTGLINVRRSPLEAMARVDVLLGPSALLNANAPVGGSILLTTKHEEDAPRTTLTARFVGDGDLGGQVDFGRRFGTDKMFGVRVNAAYDRGNTPIDRQDDHYFIASGGVDARIGRLSLSGDVIREYWRLRGAPRPFFLADGVPVPAAPDPTTNIADKGSSFTERTIILLARAEYRFSEATSLSLIYGHSRATDLYLNEIGGGQIINAAGDVTSNIIPYKPVNRVDTGQARFRTAFATGPLRHEVVASVDVVRSRSGAGFVFGDEVSTNIYRPAPNLSRFGRDVRPPDPELAKNNSDSFALADTVSALAGRVSLTAGVRRQQAQGQGKWTPAVAVVVKPVTRLSLYANYIQALESGPTADDLAVNAGQIFPPTVSNQKEIGLKYELGGGGVTVALFEINRPDFYTNPATLTFGKFGDTRNHGIEVTAFGEPVTGLRVLGGASYYDIKQRNTLDADGDGRGDTDGFQRLGSQHVRANFGVEADVPGVAGLTLTARGIYTSRTFIDADNARMLPAWTRLDLGGRYALPMADGPLTFRLYLTNATAKRYWQTTSAFFYSGVPRTLRLSLSKDF